MATLKANGTEIFRYHNTRRDGTAGPVRRVMLSGKILVERHSGGFKVVGKLKADMTFGLAANTLGRDFELTWTAPSSVWTDRMPMSTRMTAKGRPGILRAMVEAQA